MEAAMETVEAMERRRPGKVTATAAPAEAIGINVARDAQAEHGGCKQSCCGANSHRVLRFQLAP
jgi:hypothetical protein